jgi:hypothetical protein
MIKQLKPSGTPGQALSSASAAPDQAQAIVGKPFKRADRLADWTVSFDEAMFDGG